MLSGRRVDRCRSRLAPMRAGRSLLTWSAFYTMAYALRSGALQFHTLLASIDTLVLPSSLPTQLDNSVYYAHFFLSSWASVALVPQTQLHASQQQVSSAIQ